MKNARELFQLHGIKPIAWMNGKTHSLYQDDDFSEGYGIRYERVAERALEEWIPLYGPEQIEQVKKT